MIKGPYLHAELPISKRCPKIWARVSLKTPKNNPYITLDKPTS
jgi:hypothetical protein